MNSEKGAKTWKFELVNLAISTSQNNTKQFFSLCDPKLTVIACSVTATLYESTLLSYITSDKTSLGQDQIRLYFCYKSAVTAVEVTFAVDDPIKIVS